MIARPRLARLLALACAAGVSAGCDNLDRIAVLLRDHDLEFHYLGDDAGHVERASVSVDTRVIATARHTETRGTADPALTEVEVEEMHFVRGTLDVTYTGRDHVRMHHRTGLLQPPSRHTHVRDARAQRVLALAGADGRLPPSAAQGSPLTWLPPDHIPRQPVRGMDYDGGPEPGRISPSGQRRR